MVSIAKVESQLAILQNFTEIQIWKFAKNVDVSICAIPEFALRREQLSIELDASARLQDVMDILKTPSSTSVKT